MATIKQKLAAKEILENPRQPVSKVMEKVGYSTNTSVHPSDLTESKGWKELMEKYLPDDLLAKTHQNALYAKKIIVSPTEPDREIDDYANQLKAVELGYKVKGKMNEDKNVIIAGDKQVVIVNYGSDNNSIQVPTEELPTTNS